MSFRPTKMLCKRRGVAGSLLRASSKVRGQNPNLHITWRFGFVAKFQTNHPTYPRKCGSSSFAITVIVLSFEVLPFGLNKFRYVDIPGFSGFVWPAYSSNRNPIQSRFGIVTYKSYHPNPQYRIFTIYSLQFCHLKETFHTSPIKSLQHFSKLWILVRSPM